MLEGYVFYPDGTYRESFQITSLGRLAYRCELAVRFMRPMTTT